jgi:anti-sigma regulatory factor (Ser/Thr protein kinase)
MTSSHRITRAAYLESLSEFREFIKDRCGGVPGVTDEILYDVQLAVDEACTNIISHGYAGLPPGSIILDLELNPDQIVVTLTDFGHSFEPSSAPAPGRQRTHRGARAWRLRLVLYPAIGRRDELSGHRRRQQNDID